MIVVDPILPDGSESRPYLYFGGGFRFVPSPLCRGVGRTRRRAPRLQRARTARRAVPTCLCGWHRRRTVWAQRRFKTAIDVAERGSDAKFGSSLHRSNIP
ncbi:MAG: hypothetical protein QOH39_3044 [Verrucomicrobiota bacterium]